MRSHPQIVVQMVYLHLWMMMKLIYAGERIPEPAIEDPLSLF
jgi:hypothetical protein